MKKLKLTKVIASSLIIASVLAVSPIAASAEVKQEVVLATIGDQKITKSDFDKEFIKYDAKLKQIYGDDYATNDKTKGEIAQIKEQQLENIMTEKILLKKATELNLKPSDDVINKEVDDAINQYKIKYPEEGQFESSLKANGTTEDELKDYIRTSIIINAVQQDVIKDIAVTDDEVQTFYDTNKDTKFTVGAGATVAHILVAGEETAKGLKAKLDAGADFAALAKENSQDPGSKDNGGSLGFVPYNSTELVTEFMDGFKNLKEGEVSNPVKSQFGYHLIKVTGLKGSEVITFDKVRDKIKSALLQQKRGNALNSKLKEWITDLNVKVYENQL